jgi:hypothetical protein
MEFINCHMLRDKLGLLYLTMIDCQFWADAVDELSVMLCYINVRIVVLPVFKWRPFLFAVTVRFF